MMLPYWFWLLSASGTMIAIAISAYVVIFMKIAELDKRERVAAQAKSR